MMTDRADEYLRAVLAAKEKLEEERNSLLRELDMLKRAWLAIKNEGPSSSPEPSDGQE